MATQERRCRLLGKLLWNAQYGVTPLIHWSVVVPGAAAISEGEIPRVHFHARSRQRLWPVGRLDPGEERMAVHPWPTEDRHHCGGLCAALTVPFKDYWQGTSSNESNCFIFEASRLSPLWHWRKLFFFLNYSNSLYMSQKFRVYFCQNCY